MSDETTSKSKQKRLQQEKNRKEQQRNIAIKKMWAILIPLIIVAIIVAIVLYNKSLEVNYDKGLNSDGTIANVDLDNAMTADYKSISFAKSELMPSDSQIESDIENEIHDHGTLNTDPSRILSAEDTVNIIYTATKDGEVIESATDEEGGEDMVIGQGYIDPAIDQAVLDHSIGEQFNVAVSHPDDDPDEELAGKTVHYDVTIKGAYDYPEFDDEFIASYHNGEASTAEEYKNNLINNYYEDNLMDSLEDSISINCVVTDYPEDILNNTVKIAKENDKKSFESTKQMYAQYGLTLNNVYEMRGVSSEEEYNEQLLAKAKDTVRKMMFCQYIMQKEGMTNTEEEVKEFFSSMGISGAAFDKQVEETSYNYLANQAMMERVMNHLKDIVKITDDTDTITQSNDSTTSDSDISETNSDDEIQE